MKHTGGRGRGSGGALVTTNTGSREVSRYADEVG